jgi:hypothetical protein
VYYTRQPHRAARNCVLTNWGNAWSRLLPNDQSPILALLQNISADCHNSSPPYQEIVRDRPGLEFLIL